MTAGLLAAFTGPVIAGIVVFLCTRGYYRAAYGDRYERGYADGQARQIRAYQDARVALDAWQEVTHVTAILGADGRDSGGTLIGDRRVLGSRYPEAAGPPRYADLSPGALDGGPATSEWARDLIAGVEQWNAEHQLSGGPPWQD